VAKMFHNFFCEKSKHKVSVQANFETKFITGALMGFFLDVRGSLGPQNNEKWFMCAKKSQFFFWQELRRKVAVPLKFF